MTADVRLLEEIHQLFAEQIKKEILDFKKEGFPIPAADKAVYAKFLRDNNVLCVPASENDLVTLRDQLKSESRSKAMAKLKAEISGDLNMFSMN